MPIKYNLLVFIGRFQPFHHGHRRVIQLALEQSSHVLILVGSAYRARTVKNPFTYEERRSMIESALDPQEISRVTIRPLRDYQYNNNRWMQEVQKHVDVLMTNRPDRSSDERIGIIGYDKDDSSWYVHAFPQWDFVEVGKNYIEKIDATTIRDMWLAGHSPNFAVGALHNSVHNFIFEKFPKKEYDRLAREALYYKNYHASWANTPYEVIFQTTDAVVVQSGHVLLVRRKASPGEGLVALPGGFLVPRLTLLDNMMKELREETKLKVPEPVLRGNIKAIRTFDAVERSLRGRTLTNAFLIELSPGPLPKVKGGDDAAKAFWMPLAEIEKHEDQFFEDHYDILQYFLGRV